MKKISKDTPTTQRATSVYSNLNAIINNIGPALGLSVGSEIGPTNEIYIGKSSNPNVIGFTMSDSKKIFLESANFGQFIQRLNLKVNSPSQVLNFLKPIRNPENATEEIVEKCHALAYIIEILSVLIHERAHNTLNSDPGHLRDEASVQKVEAEHKKIMARRGLDIIKKLIDKHKAGKDAKNAFDKIDADYKAGMGQYRTVEGTVSKKNIIKISRLSNNINDKSYSKLLYDLALKYDKKV